MKRLSWCELANDVRWSFDFRSFVTRGGDTALCTLGLDPLCAVPKELLYARDYYIVLSAVNIAWCGYKRERRQSAFSYPLIALPGQFLTRRPDDSACRSQPTNALINYRRGMCANYGFICLLWESRRPWMRKYISPSSWALRIGDEAPEIKAVKDETFSFCVSSP